VFKLFSCQCKFNGLLKELVDVNNMVPVDRVKFYEGNVSIISFIKHFNSLLRSEVLDCGAQNKVQKFTVRHLALSMNSILMVREYILPNLKTQLINSDNYKHGFNIQKLLDNSLLETEHELDAHITDIESKFVAIINDACKPAIEAAASQIEWDAPIEKNQVVTASPYIDATVNTLFSMIKVLCQVLQLS
jgi:hypothetical protein